MVNPSSETSSGSSKPQQNSRFDAAAYVHHTAQLLQLSIPPEQMATVVENFERVYAIAQPVLDFPLPDTLESAPRFEP